MNRIKELRQASGVKQSELAKAINVSQATMSEYETGKDESDDVNSQGHDGERLDDTDDAE